MWDSPFRFDYNNIYVSPVGSDTCENTTVTRRKTSINDWTHGKISVKILRIDFFLPQLSGTANNLEGTPSYQLLPVPGSNVFLGVVINDASHDVCRRACSSCTRQVTIWFPEVLCSTKRAGFDVFDIDFTKYVYFVRHSRRPFVSVL